jgi:hypothetical protein
MVRAAVIIDAPRRARIPRFCDAPVIAMPCIREQGRDRLRKYRQTD